MNGLADWLPAWLAPTDAAAAVLAGAAVTVVILIWYGLIERDPLPARLRAIEERRAALRTELGQRMSRNRRFDRAQLMRGLVRRFKLLQGKTTASVALRVSRAGFRSRDAVAVYLVAKAVLPLAVGGAAAAAIYGLGLLPVDGMSALASVLAAVGVGLYAPDLYLKNATDKRLDKIRKALPDTFDLLVICAEAGLGLDAALDRVARETADGAPELADEVGLTAVELSFLPDRSRALANLNDRVPLPGIRALTTTLVQTERYGTPLAQSLRVLSNELRNERMMRAEEKAARLPAILTVPMIVFILPPLFVVLLGPAILRTIDAFSGM